MKIKELTDAELLVLGLVAEMPRHGYQLEQVIEQRGMREWTQIGFSSIYFVLGKLEKMGLVTAKRPTEAKAKKSYAVTDAGRGALVTQTLTALRNVRPTYSSVLLGMVHWPVLEREAALAALQARGEAIEAELARLGNIQIDQQPLPDFVEALFNFSLGQLKAEAEWIARTLGYARCVINAKFRMCGSSCALFCSPCASDEGNHFAATRKDKTRNTRNAAFATSQVCRLICTTR